MEGADRLNLKATFEAAKANRDKLDACPRHLFGDLPLSDIRFGGRIECKRCHGNMDLVALNYYIRGYVASGRSANDILPGWDAEPETNAPKGRSFFKPEG